MTQLEDLYEGDRGCLDGLHELLDSVTEAKTFSCSDLSHFHSVRRHHPTMNQVEAQRPLFSLPLQYEQGFVHKRPKEYPHKRQN